MIPQALSSTLLAAAQLHSLEPQVLQLVPAVLPQLPILVERMVPQAAFEGRQREGKWWGTSQGQIFGTWTESKKHACGETSLESMAK